MGQVDRGPNLNGRNVTQAFTISKRSALADTLQCLKSCSDGN